MARQGKITMYPKLLHLYGPFFINSYGTMIALALGIFTWLVNKDPRRARLLSSDQLYWTMILGIISGIIGKQNGIDLGVCALGGLNRLEQADFAAIVDAIGEQDHRLPAGLFVEEFLGGEQH